MKGRDYRGLILFGISIVAFGIGVSMQVKASRELKKLEKVINDISNKTEEDVEIEIMDRVAEKVAEKAASDAVKKARLTIANRVNAIVSEKYDNIEDQIREKITEEINRDISMDDLKKSVENKASMELVSKFMNNLSSYANPIMASLINNCKKENG